jgi:membrane protein
MLLQPDPLHGRARPMINPKHLFKLFITAAKAWSADYAPSMGAAISYYTVFSLAPLLIIVIAVAGAIFGHDAVQGVVVQQFSGLIGEKAASLVQGLLASASDPGKGLFAGIVSFFVLVLGATSVFTELQSALDRIWHVPESQKPSGIVAMLRSRLLSFGMILGLAFLLMVSLAVSAAVSAFGSWMGGLLPGWEILLHVVNAVFSIAVATLLFAMIYKFMPSTKIDWEHVWIGALVTAVLFELGKFVIGLYLGKSNMTQSLAAAGSIVILLAWVYYAAQIFLLGAEFTKAFADERGSHAAQHAMARSKDLARQKAQRGNDRPETDGQPVAAQHAEAVVADRQRASDR